MVDAQDYLPGRATYHAKQEELTLPRDRFAVNIWSQHGGLNVGDFGILQPAQTWLASNIASDLHVGIPRPSIMLK